ncbi:hypothetical protein BESB_079480 [Besnoitia besnoiti]|uniref:PPM-type phosphatase domain-containing protein n=1 Tax=Besnoitia besnoiti TaxID=94643 RepID=A0A2A9MEB8_BESBE|nr:hypothetical protein BESB_079480 [Besnoitia besnoiti]PFH33732.1 hypothetical protein BESB_079480 [Besnoitia besnoiti]
MQSESARCAALEAAISAPAGDVKTRGSASPYVQPFSPSPLRLARTLSGLILPFLPTAPSPVEAGDGFIGNPRGSETHEAERAKRERKTIQQRQRVPRSEYEKKTRHERGKLPHRAPRPAPRRVLVTGADHARESRRSDTGGDNVEGPIEKKAAHPLRVCSGDGASQSGEALLETDACWAAPRGESLKSHEGCEADTDDEVKDDPWALTSGAASGGTKGEEKEPDAGSVASLSTFPSLCDTHGCTSSLCLVSRSRRSSRSSLASSAERSLPPSASDAEDKTEETEDAEGGEAEDSPTSPPLDAHQEDASSAEEDAEASLPGAENAGAKERGGQAAPHSAFERERPREAQRESKRHFYRSFTRFCYRAAARADANASASREKSEEQERMVRHALSMLRFLYRLHAQTEGRAFQSQIRVAETPGSSRGDDARRTPRRQQTETEINPAASGTLGEPAITAPERRTPFITSSTASQLMTTSADSYSSSFSSSSSLTPLSPGAAEDGLRTTLGGGGRDVETGEGKRGKRASGAVADGVSKAGATDQTAADAAAASEEGEPGSAAEEKTARAERGEGQEREAASEGREGDGGGRADQLDGTRRAPLQKLYEVGAAGSGVAPMSSAAASRSGIAARSSLSAEGAEGGARQALLFYAAESEVAWISSLDFDEKRREEESTLLAPPRDRETEPQRTRSASCSPPAGSRHGRSHAASASSPGGACARLSTSSPVSPSFPLTRAPPPCPPAAPEAAWLPGGLASSASRPAPQCRLARTSTAAPAWGCARRRARNCPPAPADELAKAVRKTEAALLALAGDEETARVLAVVRSHRMGGEAAAERPLPASGESPAAGSQGLWVAGAARELAETGGGDRRGEAPAGDGGRCSGRRERGLKGGWSRSQTVEGDTVRQPIAELHRGGGAEPGKTWDSRGFSQAQETAEGQKAPTRWSPLWEVEGGEAYIGLNRRGSSKTNGTALGAAGVDGGDTREEALGDRARAQNGEAEQSDGDATGSREGSRATWQRREAGYGGSNEAAAALQAAAGRETERQTPYGESQKADREMSLPQEVKFANKRDGARLSDLKAEAELTAACVFSATNSGSSLPRSGDRRRVLYAASSRAADEPLVATLRIVNGKPSWGNREEETLDTCEPREGGCSALHAARALGSSAKGLSIGEGQTANLPRLGPSSPSPLAASSSPPASGSRDGLEGRASPSSSPPVSSFAPAEAAAEADVLSGRPGGVRSQTPLGVACGEGAGAGDKFDSRSTNDSGRRQGPPSGDRRGGGVRTPELVVRWTEPGAEVVEVAGAFSCPPWSERVPLPWDSAEKCFRLNLLQVFSPVVLHAPEQTREQRLHISARSSSHATVSRAEGGGPAEGQHSPAMGLRDPANRFSPDAQAGEKKTFFSSHLSSLLFDATTRWRTPFSRAGEETDGDKLQPSSSETGDETHAEAITPSDPTAAVWVSTASGDGTAVLHLQLKFIVNGEWKCSKAFPVQDDGSGNLNNVVVLFRSRAPTPSTSASSAFSRTQTSFSSSIARQVDVGDGLQPPRYNPSRSPSSLPAFGDAWDVSTCLGSFFFSPAVPLSASMSLSASNFYPNFARELREADREEMTSWWRTEKRNRFLFFSYDRGYGGNATSAATCIDADESARQEDNFGTREGDASARRGGEARLASRTGPEAKTRLSSSSEFERGASMAASSLATPPSPVSSAEPSGGETRRQGFPRDPLSGGWNAQLLSTGALGASAASASLTEDTGDSSSSPRSSSRSPSSRPSATSSSGLASPAARSASPPQSAPLLLPAKSDDAAAAAEDRGRLSRGHEVLYRTEGASGRRGAATRFPAASRRVESHEGEDRRGADAGAAAWRREGGAGAKRGERRPGPSAAFQEVESQARHEARDAAGRRRQEASHEGEGGAVPEDKASAAGKASLRQEGRPRDAPNEERGDVKNGNEHERQGAARRRLGAPEREGAQEATHTRQKNATENVVRAAETSAFVDAFGGASAARAAGAAARLLVVLLLFCAEYFALVLLSLRLRAFFCLRLLVCAAACVAPVLSGAGRVSAGDAAGCLCGSRRRRDRRRAPAPPRDRAPHPPLARAASTSASSAAAGALQLSRPSSASAGLLRCLSAYESGSLAAADAAQSDGTIRRVTTLHDAAWPQRVLDFLQSPDILFELSQIHAEREKQRRQGVQRAAAAAGDETEDEADLSVSEEAERRRGEEEAEAADAESGGRPSSVEDEENLRKDSRRLALQCGAYMLPHPEKLESGGADAFFIASSPWDASLRNAGDPPHGLPAVASCASCAPSLAACASRFSAPPRGGKPGSLSTASDAVCVGVADGVGEWESFGLNPRMFAEELMTGCWRAALAEPWFRDFGAPTRGADGRSAAAGDAREQSRDRGSQAGKKKARQEDEAKAEVSGGGRRDAAASAGGKRDRGEEGEAHSADGNGREDEGRRQRKARESRDSAAQSSGQTEEDACPPTCPQYRSRRRATSSSFHSVESEEEFSLFITTEDGASMDTVRSEPVLRESSYLSCELSDSGSPSSASPPPASPTAPSSSPSPLTPSSPSSPSASSLPPSSRSSASSESPSSSAPSSISSSFSSSSLSSSPPVSVSASSVSSPPSSASDVGVTGGRADEAGRKALEILRKGFAATRSFGSSTALVVCLDGLRGRLGIANLGDSALMLLRRQPRLCRMTCAHRSQEQQHQFNCPFQLSCLPTPSQYADLVGQGKGTLVRVLRSATMLPQDTPDMARVYCVSAQEGDLLILGTDGVFDNLFDHEICSLANLALSPYEACELLGDASRATSAQAVAAAIAEAAAYKSCNPLAKTPFMKHARRAKTHFMGGKMDDITVVACWVTREPHASERGEPRRPVSSPPESASPLAADASGLQGRESGAARGEETGRRLHGARASTCQTCV